MKRKLFTFLLALASIGLIHAAKVQIGELYYYLQTWDETAEVTYEVFRDPSNYSSITAVDIPASVVYEGQAYTVTSIADEAFYKCNSLTSVTIPESVTSIGISAFSDCSNLTSVIIQNGITSIENYTFFDCRSLTSVTIPESVTSIGKRAFYHCSSLTSVTIPESITSIKTEAFGGCANLHSVIWNAKRCADFSSQSTPFYESGYSYNTDYRDSINSFTFGEKVEYIPAYLCSGLKGLNSVTISNSVTGVGSSAFQQCYGLTRVNISDLEAWFNISFSDKYANPLENAQHLFLNDVEIADLVIPNNITCIKDYTFYNCRSLNTVTIPNSVTSIGKSAFTYCSNLKKVNISDIAAWYKISFSDASANPLSNAGHLFLNDVEIVDLVIPNNVSSIKDYTFFGCSGLNSVTIPKSVTSIGKNAFDICNNLKKVNISDLGAWCNIFWGNSSANPLYYANHLFLNDEEIIDLVIPNNISSIKDYAFYRCSGLKSVTIPNSVTSIGNEAFYGCYTMSMIIALPKTPPTITSNTFRTTISSVYVEEQALSAYKSKSYWKNMNLLAISSTETMTAPTSASINTIHNLWALTNKYIASYSVEGGETFEGNILEFNGLEPETEYNKTIALTSNTGETDTINVSFTTTALELTTQQPKIVSSSMAILLAETNMADAEVNCGFEWRRDNQPEGMASTKVYAPVANGIMAGRLKGLKDDVYYKYRAFYESSAGNKYYGDWQYIFTGDQTVEFDPVMYTYPAQAVTETTAILRGYALAGSDDFIEQGFEYWVEKRVTPESAAGAPYRAYRSAIGEHMTVQASGISMKVTLTDLDEGSVYKYRSYAVVDGQTVYGSEETFTTRGEYLYTVTFVDYDGTILGTDKVHYGTAATAPEDPTRDGYNFAGWDTDFSNVTDDLTITATYSIATALPETQANGCGVHKFLRNGQIFILRDGKTYTVQGQEVK